MYVFVRKRRPLFTLIYIYIPLPTADDIVLPVDRCIIILTLDHMCVGVVESPTLYYMCGDVGKVGKKIPLTTL